MTLSIFSSSTFVFLFFVFNLSHTYNKVLPPVRWERRPEWSEGHHRVNDKVKLSIWPNLSQNIFYLTKYLFVKIYLMKIQIQIFAISSDPSDNQKTLIVQIYLTKSIRKLLFIQIYSTKSIRKLYFVQIFLT